MHHKRPAATTADYRRTVAFNGSVFLTKLGFNRLLKQFAVTISHRILVRV